MEKVAKKDAHLESRMDRHGVWGGPGRSSLASRTVAQLMLIGGQDLLMSAGLCSISRYGQLHFFLLRKINGPHGFAPLKHLPADIIFKSWNILKFSELINLLQSLRVRQERKRVKGTTTEIKTSIEGRDASLWIIVTLVPTFNPKEINASLSRSRGYPKFHISFVVSLFT